MDSDSLSDVYAASLGHYVENPSGWNGLFINDPFSLPTTVVSIVVDGVDKVTVQDAKTQKYALVGPVANYFDGVAENVVDADLSQGLDVVSLALVFFLMDFWLISFCSFQNTLHFLKILNQLSMKRVYQH